MANVFVSRVIIGPMTIDVYQVSIVSRLFSTFDCLLFELQLFRFENFIIALRSECDANKNECNEVIPNSHCSRLSNDSAVCECLPGFLESNHHHQSCEPIPTTTTTTTMTPKTIETQPMQTITGIYLSLLINFF